MRDYGLTHDDSEVAVTLGALTHCIGMSVHRDGHEDFSLFLAEPKLRELLEGLYDEPEKTVIVSEVLQTITSHREYGKPLDARGRNRARRRRARHGAGPFAHPVRARPRVDPLALGGRDRGRDDRGRRGATREDRDRHEQLVGHLPGRRSLLKAKLSGSGLEPYVEVVAHIDTEAEKSLVPVYRLET